MSNFVVNNIAKIKEELAEGKQLICQFCDRKITYKTRAIHASVSCVFRKGWAD